MRKKPVKTILTPGAAKRARPSSRARELEELRARLAEAEETLRAIGEGEVDAVIVSGTRGEQVYSLIGAESVYRLIVETMKEAAFTVTFEGRILFCNAQFGEFVRRPLEQIVGHPLREFVAPDNAATAESMLALGQSQSLKQRLVFQGADGCQVPAHVSAVALNQAGQLSICVVATDLTDLERSTELIQQLCRQQEALRESELRYRTVADNTYDFEFWINPEGRYMYASSGCRRVYGREPAEFLADAMVRRAVVCLEDQAAFDRHTVDEHNRVPGEVEFQILRTDGKLRWISHVCQPVFDELGNYLGLRGSNRDVTERNRTDELLRRAKELSEALNRVNEALHSTLEFHEIMQLLVDVGAAALGSETAAVSLRQQDSWTVSRLNGLPASLVGARFIDDEERHAVLAIQSGRPVAVTDAWNDNRLNQDHMRKHNVRAVLVAPLIGRGGPLGALFFNYHTGPHSFTEAEVSFAGQLAATAAVALDNARLFGERNRALEALRQVNASLEQKVQERTEELAQRAGQLRALAGELTLSVQRERRRVAKVLHDDLQQLLVGAKFRAALLSRNLGEQHKAVLKEIDDLLDESLSASRSLTADLSPPILHESGLLFCLQWLARWMAGKHDLMVNLVMEEDIPALPEDVKIFLFESVRELLFNAVKHASVLTAHVQVSVAYNQLHIEVKDEGTGFDPRRLKPAGTSGGGFGLFSIRERMDLIGGKMEIHSAPGKGSRFVITLPVSQASSSHA